jgi:hypothetical protein
LGERKGLPPHRHNLSLSGNWDLLNEHAQFLVTFGGQAESAGHALQPVGAVLSYHLIPATPPMLMSMETQFRKNRESVFGGRSIRLHKAMKCQPIGGHPGHRMNGGQLDHNPLACVLMKRRRECGEIRNVVEDVVADDDIC